MSVYVIGDIQGCYDDLQKLLKKINFQKSKDKLVFCGDLVNRGGKSLKVLRWVYKNRDCCQVTLGNHDLSLLAQYYIPKFRKKRNLEFQKIFRAKECDTLMNWLCNQNLVLSLEEFNTTVVHAGIHPFWSMKRALKESKKIEVKLSKNPIAVFGKMFGTKPNHWEKSLKGMDKTRFAINSFTRMRFLYKNSGLNFKAKGEPESFPQFIPWFKQKYRKNIKSLIVFGHWSALGLHYQNNTLCIDTGKVWGGKLTALKLDKSGLKSKHIYQV